MLLPPCKLRRLVAAVALAAVAALPERAVAQAPVADLRYSVRLVPSGVVAGASYLAVFVPEAFKARLPHAACGPCDPGGLWRLDRSVVGPFRGGPATMSHVTLLASMAGAGALMARAREGASARWEDLAVLGQALLIDLALTDWIKVATSRPRPFLYDAAAVPGEPDDGLSFPSGHTSLAFAAAAAYASVQHRRGVADRHRTTIGVLFATAAATGALRVLAREHFPTDVVAGAVLGTAVGWVVPRVHPVQPR